MKFVAEHAFEAVSLPAFERLFFDEAFNEAMCKQVAIERELRSREVLGQRLVREVMVYPERQVPGPIAKLIGNTKIGYSEALEYTFGDYRGTFRCTPTAMADRVTTEGIITLEARGNSVVRRVTGEVKVRVFGVGGVIERFIVADVEKSYEDAAKFTVRYLQEHGAP